MHKKSWYCSNTCLLYAIRSNRAINDEDEQNKVALNWVLYQRKKVFQDDWQWPPAKIHLYFTPGRPCKQDQPIDFSFLSLLLILSESEMTNIVSWEVTLSILCVLVSVPVCVRGHFASVQRETRQINNALIQISSGATVENPLSNKTVKDPVGSSAQTGCQRAQLQSTAACAPVTQTIAY